MDELFSPPSLNISNSVTVKFTQQNDLLWKSWVLSLRTGQHTPWVYHWCVCCSSSEAKHTTIPVHGIAGNIDANPDYATWVCYRADQVVWLLGSLSEDLLGVVINCRTSKDIWVTLVSTLCPLQGCSMASFNASPSFAALHEELSTDSSKAKERGDF